MSPEVARTEIVAAEFDETTYCGRSAANAVGAIAIALTAAEIATSFLRIYIPFLASGMRILNEGGECRVNDVERVLDI
jgi:hypothetical protein